MSDSQSFNHLHEGVRRWVWLQNWTALRDIQEYAIEPILAADRDVIIAASTAAGKTEAAFLPACSRLAHESPNGIGILYISPLKALINDQHRRIQSLCESIDMPITPWHGDVLRTVKEKQIRNPKGVVLITPESLESLLLNNGAWCQKAFANLLYIILDEFHAFIGSERGCQLQSLLHRIEFMLGKTIPRIALSATLGNMQEVPAALRPNANYPCEIITSDISHSDLKVQLRGYKELIHSDNEKDNNTPALKEITHDLYALLRGKSHLVFANSRSRTEEIVTSLSDSCEHNGVRNEFFPHHGSLSKDIREDLEKRLQEEKLPTTAVCTMTLELGIDVGHVDSIAQVTAPHSVSSLRQRLGRSGRRGNAAVLRMFIAEDELTDTSHLIDRLRMETFQSVAMVNLLLQRWYEPANNEQYHFSTLIQQTLSVIGHYGGVRADQLWKLLCGSGPFIRVDQTMYTQLLRSMGEYELISQMHDGQLIIGHRGEQILGHFSFFTAFNTPEEYRLESVGRVLGTIPITFPLMLGQHILFAGQRWEVISVVEEEKLIELIPSPGGRPPKFGGQGSTVHDKVRQEMFKIYLSEKVPVYLNQAARQLFSEGMKSFHALGLGASTMLQVGKNVHILTWRGDRITNTLTAMLKYAGLSADSFGGIIDVQETSIEACRYVLLSIFKKNKPTISDLAREVQNTMLEKHDCFVPETLRMLDYGAKFFDVESAWDWLNAYVEKVGSENETKAS